MVDDAGVPTAAVDLRCAASLELSPLVAGHQVTGFTNSEEAAVGATDWVKSNAMLIEDKFKEQGGEFIGGPDWASNVVVSKNLITAQNPGSAVACAGKVVELLAA